MEFDDNDVLFEQSCLIVEDFISQDPQLFEEFFKSAREKRMRHGKRNKINYWETTWGKILQDPKVRDPTSKFGKLFRRRFRYNYF